MEGGRRPFWGCTVSWKKPNVAKCEWIMGRKEGRMARGTRLMALWWNITLTSRPELIMEAGSLGGCWQTQSSAFGTLESLGRDFNGGSGSDLVVLPVFCFPSSLQPEDRAEVRCSLHPYGSSCFHCRLKSAEVVWLVFGKSFPISGWKEWCVLCGKKGIKV